MENSQKESNPKRQSEEASNMHQESSGSDQGAGNLMNMAQISYRYKCELHSLQVRCDVIKDQIKELKQEVSKEETDYEFKNQQLEHNLQVKSILTAYSECIDQLISTKEMTLEVLQANFNDEQLKVALFEKQANDTLALFDEINRETAEIFEKDPLAQQCQKMRNDVLRRRTQLAMVLQNIHEQEKKNKQIRKIRAKQEQLKIIEFAKFMVEYRKMQEKQLKKKPEEIDVEVPAVKTTNKERTGQDIISKKIEDDSIIFKVPFLKSLDFPNDFCLSKEKIEVSPKRILPAKLTISNINLKRRGDYSLANDPKRLIVEYPPIANLHRSIQRSPRTTKSTNLRNSPAKLLKQQSNQQIRKSVVDMMVKSPSQLSLVNVKQTPTPKRLGKEYSQSQSQEKEDNIVQKSAQPKYITDQKINNTQSTQQKQSKIVSRYFLDETTSTVKENDAARLVSYTQITTQQSPTPSNKSILSNDNKSSYDADVEIIQSQFDANTNLNSNIEFTDESNQGYDNDYSPYYTGENRSAYQDQMQFVSPILPSNSKERNINETVSVPKQVIHENPEPNNQQSNTLFAFGGSENKTDRTISSFMFGF